MTDELVEKIKKVIKESPNMRLMTDEEFKDVAEHAKTSVRQSEIEHIFNTPAFAKKEFKDLHNAWEKLDKNDEKSKSILLGKFGKFPIESHEVITLKKGVSPEEWAQYVNLNKGDPYSYAVVKATISMARYLLILTISPQEAWNRVAKKEDLTGFMMGALISTIVQFTPRGEEVREAWNKHHSTERKGVVNPALWTLKT